MKINLDGLIEDGVEEEVAFKIAVGKVDGQTDGASGKGISGNERVGNCGLLKFSMLKICSTKSEVY